MCILYRFLNPACIIIRKSVLFKGFSEHLFVRQIFVTLHKNTEVDTVNMYEKILQLCNEKGIKPATLCKAAGIPKSTLSELKQGRTKTLSTQTLGKIAQYFNVSLGYFDDTVDGVEETRDELFRKRKLLFDISKRATEEQLDTFLVMFQALIDKEER